MQEKIKPILNGAAETMLQSFYARAQYSKSKRHRLIQRGLIVERVVKNPLMFTNEDIDLCNRDIF